MQRELEPEDELAPRTETVKLGFIDLDFEIWVTNRLALCLKGKKPNVIHRMFARLLLGWKIK